MKAKTIFFSALFLVTLLGNITHSEGLELESNSCALKALSSHLWDMKVQILGQDIEVTSLDNIGVRDSTTNAGEFNVGLPILKVTDGWGCAGSSENIIQMIFENGFQAMGIQFDLLFDTTFFNVSQIEQTDRTDHLEIFSWSSLENGIRMVMTNHGGISPGRGSIADIRFDVMEDTPPGDYKLSLSNVSTADMYAFRYEVITVDGTFHVVLKKGDVNSDGVVSVEDVITTVDIIIGFYKPTVYEFAAADCNDDDKINVLDVVCILNIILGN